MKKWPKGLLVGGIVILGVVTSIGGGFLYFIYRMGPLVEATASAEFTANAGAQFGREYPPIYHFLAQLPDYRVTHFRVQRGLGGRWGKLTLRREADALIDGAALAKVLEQGLKSEGWTKGAWSIDGARDLLAIDPAKLGADDLQYGHPPLKGERENVSHNLRIWVAPDGGESVAYCEMGW